MAIKVALATVQQAMFAMGLAMAAATLANTITMAVIKNSKTIKPNQTMKIIASIHIITTMLRMPNKEKRNPKKVSSRSIKELRETNNSMVIVIRSTRQSIRIWT